MYAVITSGGKQYKVKEGDVVSVERLCANPGDKVTFDVLMAGGEQGVKAGNPVLEGAVVTGEVVKEYRDEKIVIFRYKAKKNIRKKQGHRQPYTLVKISGISL